MQPIDNKETCGRLAYVEPTILGLENNYSDSINFPYEDYSMSIDLSVVITDRFSCGWASASGEQTRKTWSSRKGTLSFLGGSKIDDSKETYLTTNFTDISMTSPGTNTSECLGIESISISYSQWMFPQVIVKFVDVRGATVMMPSENNYYNESDRGTSSDIYRSLFSFPYPMFELKVKGFYGKGVTYKLAVQKTDLEFNNDTGNFNITVSFIGYMYGLYADIPMTYLAAAPYMEGGKEYWLENTQNGYFKFRDASGQYREPMLTIPKLRDRLAEAANNYSAISVASEGQQVLDGFENRISLLKSLEDNFPFKTDKWFFDLNSQTYFSVVNTFEDIKNIRGEIGLFYNTIETYDKTHNTGNKDSFSATVKELKEYIKEELINTSADYRSTYTKKFSKQENEFSLKFNANSGVDLSYNNGTDIDVKEINTRIILNPSLNSFIKNKSRDINNYYVVFIQTNSPDGYVSFISNLSNSNFSGSVISTLIKNRDEERKRYKEKELSIIEQIIGFRPSIRNIFNLIFAHMETFMHCFYENTKNIKDELDKGIEYRNKNFHGLVRGETDTEEPSNNEIQDSISNKHSTQLPPYFAYYKYENEVDKTGKMTFKWPGLLPNSDKLQEINFVQNLLGGAQLYYDEVMKLSGKTISSTNGYASNPVSTLPPSTNISSFLPLTNYDFVFKDVISNPYNDFKKDISNNGNDISDNILGTFVLRAFYYLCTNEKFSDTVPSRANHKEARGFGILEAINLYKCIGNNVSEQFINFINNCRYDDLFKTNVTWKINNEGKQLFTKGNRIRYNLSDYYPVGVFNFLNIKKDLNSNEDINNLNTYLNIKGESINSFFIFEEKNFLSEIYNNLNSDLTRLKEGLSIDNEDNNSFEMFKPNKTEKKFIDNFNNKVNSNELVIYKDSIEDQQGNKVNQNEFLGILIDTKENWDKFYIKYPVRVLNTTPIFDSYEYSSVSTIEERAYLFLQNASVMCAFETKRKNGLETKFSLLKEGSYYWMIKNSKDDKLKNTLISKLPKNRTVSREKRLLTLFEDWVNGASNSNSLNDISFAFNEKFLVNKELYGINKNGERDFSKGLDIEILKTNDKDFNNGHKLQKFLRNLFFDVYTVIDLYDGIYDGHYDFSCEDKNLKSAFDGFKTQLNKIYKNIKDELNTNPITYAKKRAESESKNPFLNDDIRLTTYMTLKSLYDKWLCSPQKGPLNTWSLSSSESDFNSFLYVDTFYHDIGDRLTVNIDKVSSWLSSCLPTSNLEGTESSMVYTGKTVYEFLTSVSQDSGGMLLALPHKIGAYNSGNINEMFTPMPLYSNWDDDSSTFVFMYTYKPSEHLGDNTASKYDMNGWSKEGDGIDLTNDEIMGKLLQDNGYTVPAFGVTYAKQNQSIFKNIRLSTQNNGVTEAGLAATFNIVSKTSESPRETMLYGQDLYRVFSQYSYKCSAECMGNMQITPLMYFQLNNVPLWKGGYQIYKVNHEITAGNITTNFEGMRINRYAIPLSSDVVITGIDDGFHVNETEKIINENINLNEDNIQPNPNINLPKNKIYFQENNITKEKPLICLTPAHGPNTKKREEWVWSTKVVNRIYEIFRDNPNEYKFYDGSLFLDNVQLCNQDGRNTGTGYSMKETKTYINKFGSTNVISAVPHWNGGRGRYHWTMVNQTKLGIREDSMKLAECMRGEFLKIKEKWELDEKYGSMFGGDCRIAPEPDDVDDGAPKLKCACVLTENWFADYSSNAKEWFNGDGIEEIAQAHAKAIKKYIYQLIPPTFV